MAPGSTDVCPYLRFSNSGNNVFMQNTYLIIWVAKDRDRSGVGQKQLNKEQAEALALHLNQNYPGFLHRAIDPHIEDTATALEALRTAVSTTRGQAMPVPEFASLQASKTEAATIIDPVRPKIAAPLDDFVPLQPMIFT